MLLGVITLTKIGNIRECVTWYSGVWNERARSDNAEA
jgi:hypothetical protein